MRIYIFPLWRSDFFFQIRCRIRRISVDGSRIRKEKIADSKISGYVWTRPNTSGSLGEREMLWEHEAQVSVSTAFSSFPTIDF